MQIPRNTQIALTLTILLFTVSSTLTTFGSNYQTLTQNTPNTLIKKNNGDVHPYTGIDLKPAGTYTGFTLTNANLINADLNP